VAFDMMHACCFPKWDAEVPTTITNLRHLFRHSRIVVRNVGGGIAFEHDGEAVTRDAIAEMASEAGMSARAVGTLLWNIEPDPLLILKRVRRPGRNVAG
jgi:hypothetical protein